MMKTKLYMIVFLAIYFISACNTNTEKSIKQKEDTEHIPVIVEVLNYQIYEMIVEGIGKSNSKQRATIIFESQGQLEKIHHKVGDVLSMGDVIAEINSTTYQSVFKLAEASYNKAKLDLDDARTLLQKSVISDDEFNQLNLSLISTKSNYTQARERYEKCSLKAPFNGTIVDMNLNLGEYITPSQYLLPPVILADMNQLIIEVSVSEKEISQVQVGQNVLIHVKAYNDSMLYGKVSQVGLITSQRSNSFKVEISLINPGSQLKLGMIADVSIISHSFNQALVISRKYILEDSDGGFVFVNNGGKALKKRITIDDSRRGIAMVSGELSLGDSLITQGYRKVSVGSFLKAVN